MFISLCEAKMAFLADTGYGFWLESRHEKYERISWQKEDVRISIDHSSYEFRLELSIYIHGKEVDINRLFGYLKIPCRSSYGYYGSGMEKGIDYFVRALEKLICGICQTDEDLIARLEDNLLPPPVPLGEAFLKAGDNAYLNGNFKSALYYYDQAEEFMDALHKKRYERTLSILVRHEKR